MELAEFLVEAKKYTYAYGGSREYRSLEDGSLEFSFHRDGFEFRDRYFGFEKFAGEEAVFFEGEAIWIMNYRGGFLDKDGISADEVYQFLRKALLTITIGSPFRGGKYFSEERCTYMNHIEGNLSKFQGSEFILCDKEKVYELVYHGGSIS